MNEEGNPHQQALAIQRVRCRQCHLPLIQLYQGDIFYTLQTSEEECASQPVPAYMYRTLTDPTPLLLCPRCAAPLSPTSVTVIPIRTRVVEEKKPEQ